MASEAPHPPAGAIPIAGAQPKVFANHQHLSKLAALIAPKPMGPGGKPIVKPAPPPDVEVKLEHLTAARPRAAAKKRRPAAKPTFSAGGETKEEAEEEPAPAIKVTVAAPVQPAALAPSPSLQSLPNPAPSPANKAAEAAVAPLDSDLVDVTPQNVANVIRTLTREVAVLEQSVAELRAQQRGLHAQLAQLHTQALSMGHDAPGPIPFPDDKRTAVQAMQAAANKVFKAGWITKEGSTVRNWKKRYFILYSDHIDYYENPRSDGKPLGSIDLRGCKVSPLKVRAGVGKPCIEVTLAERRWHFFAETPRENTSWFSAISNRAETLAYVHRCDKAKTAPNAVILDFLNRYNSENFGGVGEHLRIHNQPLALDSVALLARMISDPSQFSTPIRVLELVNCGLKDVDFGVLMDSLATNNTVTHLLVKGNPISSASCKNIAQVLASRASHLQHLMIEECPITDAGVALLLPTLKPSRLKRLQLVACSLSAASAKQLAHIIGSREEAPATLIELVLDGNAIADEGANALSSMLATAPSLLSLSAKDCGFTDAAATALAEALHARGVRLSSLLVNGPRNAFSASGSQQLAAAVQTTPSLQSAAFSQYALSQTELSVLQLISAYGFASPVRA